ncbi:MAG: LamG domain-containing protein [Polyangia bacterium]
MRTESNTRRHLAMEPPSAPDGKSAEGMPHVRESRLILAVAAFVAVVLAAACSFDASRLRPRRFADSGASEAVARDTDATEVDALLDHPFDQNLGVQDSVVEVGSDWASAMFEVGALADAGSSMGDAADRRTDLPLGTDGSVDTGGAGGTDGGATGGTDGSVDTGGAGGTGGGATAGTNGSVDTGGAGGTGGGATAGTNGSVDTGGAGGTGGGATGGTAGSGSTSATGGSGGSVSLPAGLVAWWKMDEAAGSDTATDASGNGNTATLTGLNPASAWTTGRTGGALKCDGSGGALVNDSVSLDGITTGVTIAAWVNRLSATTGFSAVLSRETGTTNGQYYWLGLSGDDAEFYGLSGVLSTTTVPMGIWTHMAATHDGTTARIYVNGAQVTSKSSSDVFKADTSKLTICGNQNDASGAITELWNGLVDDLQLYNRVLTATEIANLAK